MRGREVVDEDGDAAVVGDEAPLLWLVKEGAGAREADIDALVSICGGIALEGITPHCTTTTHPLDGIVARHL